MIVLTDILRKISNYFANEWVLVLILLLIPLVIFLVRKDFVKFKEDPETAERKRKTRKVVMILRILFVILMLIAIAGPQITREKNIDGDAYVQLLVDTSNSMNLFAKNAPELQQALEKKVTVDTKNICVDDVSNIGDAILNSMQPGGSVLLFSDGNANAGADLGDVALYASKMNTTINAVSLDVINPDASVVVFGPSKTMENAENTFGVEINKAGDIYNVHVTVSVDGVAIIDEDTSEDYLEFTKQFAVGTHRITAQISCANDYFSQNNIYFKTVRVVSKPKVLFLSESSSPLQTLLSNLYSVDSRSSPPSSFDDYYAVVVNDMPSDSMNSVTESLNTFVSDGNGLVVVGGENSYDEGGYRNSVFETLLPVFVGTPEKKEGDVNVALVIDISGSTGSAYGSGKAVDVEKALAVSALKDLSLNTRLAVVVFNSEAKMISAPNYVFEQPNIEDTISRLKDGGGTLISAGIMKAVQVISGLSGSKNIILISDGKTQAESASVEAARYASKNGIKIYTVGVGASTNEDLMRKLAETTNGIYFKADEESRLRLLFGDPDDQEDQSGKMSFTILDSNHFITEGLKPSANLAGFNSVTPKTTARLLGTTSGGDPVLAIWRLGLGRVVSLAVDDGSKWAGPLLSKQNSKIITRMMNWAIGDPERKSSAFVEAKDTRLNEPAEITVKSSSPPKSEGVSFFKVSEDTYSGSIISDAIGFQETAGAAFAVNYPLEYETTGISDQLNLIVSSTGGRIYSANNINEIVENAKTKAKRTIVTREPLIWPFAAAAVLLYLLEIFIRRILRKE